MNPTTEFANILQALLDKHSRGILTGCVARIEAHNTATMRADITPLLLVTDPGNSSPTTYSVVSDVPVGFLHAGGFIIRPKYNRGDIVWVNFATHSIEKALSGSPDRTDGRLFSVENACVAFGMSKSDFTAPPDFGGDGILICNESGDTRWMIENGTVTIKSASLVIEADVTIRGKITQNGDFETSGDVKTDKDVTWLAKSTPTKASTHIHGTGVGPSAAPKPGS